MLSYACNLINIGQYKKLETEDFKNNVDLLAAVLSKAVSHLIKNGLGREYESLIEATTFPRGKVDISSSLKFKHKSSHNLICEYDELTINTKMNQIIKATLLALINEDISYERKKELKMLLMYFDKVTLINIYNIQWKFQYNRNNKNYQLILTICKLIIDSKIQSQNSGKLKIIDLLDEKMLHKLYEKFILEFYKKECPKFKVSSSKINWKLDDGDIQNLPTMQSDIMIEFKNKVLIVDAKYYSNNMQSYFNKKTIISGNLYQIFTYVKNKQLEDEEKVVSGMLLYARTDEAIQPDNTFKMSGNKIYVKTLDLNNEFSLIKEQLLDIVNKIIDTSN